MIEDMYYIVTCYFITYGYKRGKSRWPFFSGWRNKKKPRKFRGFSVSWVFIY